MISQAYLKTLFNYDPETGIFTRIVSRSNRTKTGERAGINRSDGYLSISIDHGRYLSHRLAWLYVYGCWPNGMLDHVNMDRSDNRISNLRIATRSENFWNAKCRSHSKIGLKGVTRNGERYQAQIRVDKQRIYLGTYDTPAEAHAAYVTASAKYHGEFARAA